MSVKIQIDHWGKIKNGGILLSAPKKVSQLGKNFEGKFVRQKWGQIETCLVFVTSPMLGKVQKQDFVSNQSLIKRTLIFTPFRKTQNSDRFQTKSGEKRSDFRV